MGQVQSFIGLFFKSVLDVAKRYGNKDIRDKSNEDIYQNIFTLIPRLVCADGFSISVQCGNGSYCASENGYRHYGHVWEKVEWGFPSEEIDRDKYNADCGENESTTTAVGMVHIDLIEELVTEHGGLDLVKMWEGMLKKS